MSNLRKLAWTLSLLAILGGAGYGVAQAPDANTPPPDPIAPQPIEPQTRGPLHEAIAQPLDPSPQPGQLVPKEPPAPIPELPPDEQPDGKNLQWMPGYWSWDADRNDFVWISGVYRDAPAGRRFVPGYWAHGDDGWRWVPGFWAPEGQDEMPYTPEPPATLEAGPTQPPPGDDSMYIPGTWLYRDGRFVWQPGYWSAVQPGRVWVPPRYLWTPAGYVFVNGYWDWPFEDRGLVFAPVYFNQPLWNQPGWAYRPSYVVNWGALTGSLFYRPGGAQFYFGNYYGPRYAGLGYRPWFNGYNRFDGIFNYQRWQNRHNANWFANDQQAYRDHHDGRRAGTGTPMITSVHRAHGADMPRLHSNPAFAQSVKGNLQRTHDVAAARRQIEARGTSLGTGSLPTRAVPHGTHALKLPPATGASLSVPRVSHGTANVVTPHVGSGSSVRLPPIIEKGVGASSLHHYGPAGTATHVPHVNTQPFHAGTRSLPSIHTPTVPHISQPRLNTAPLRHMPSPSISHMPAHRPSFAPSAGFQPHHFTPSHGHVAPHVHHAPAMPHGGGHGHGVGHRR
jgi:hypothetical protein